MLTLPTKYKTFSQLAPKQGQSPVMVEAKVMNMVLEQNLWLRLEVAD